MAFQITPESQADAAALDKNTDWYHFGKPAMILTAATGAAAVALPIIFGALSLAGKISLTLTSWPVLSYVVVLGASTLWFGPRVFQDAYRLFFKVVYGHFVYLYKVKIEKNGGWTPSANGYDSCYFDSPALNRALGMLVVKKNISSAVDLGCGNCSFLKAIQKLKPAVQIKGYDANPETAKISGNVGETADISAADFANGKDKADLVMCIETAEHIPTDKADALITNICELSKKYILIGWAVKGQGGHGHVNEQNNDWVIEKFRQKGFKVVIPDTVYLRKQAGDAAVFWNQNLILFEKA